MTRAAITFLIPCLLAAQDFAKDVAPVFAKHCIGCHAGNVKMGSLDLDTVDAAMKGGNHGTVIVPGKSDESRLYLMLVGKATPAMPLSGESLPAGDIDKIKKWIDLGAKPSAVVVSQLASTDPAPALAPKHSAKAQIGALAWRPDGQMIALAGYKDVRLADPTGKTLATLTGHAEFVRAVAFSPDGKLLAAAGGLPGRRGEVKIWDVESRKEVRAIRGHSDCIYAIAFSPDGKAIATSSYDKLIKLWDPATGAELRTLKDHIDAVYDLAFLPDGSRLLSAGADRSLKIWNPATGERLYTLSDALDGLNTIVLSPDGKKVAAAGLDKTIRIYSINEKSGALENTLIAHEDAILRLAWSPDGTTLVSSSADRTIKLFRASDLAELKQIDKQPDWVTALRFSPDGRQIAAGRFDGSLEFIPIAARTAARTGIRPPHASTHALTSIPTHALTFVPSRDREGAVFSAPGVSR